jgi:glucosamine-6-phosphate deaminase
VYRGGLISSQIYRSETRASMGAAAAQHAARRIREWGATQEFIPVVFATGASQLETLRALVNADAIPWQRVIGFHLDEYVGIGAEHPASFRRYLKQELVSRVAFRQFHWLDGDAVDPVQVCVDYAAKLRTTPPVLCLLGIGENGHLAFNDPPEADFEDPADVKLVKLDPACRQQQVNEGWFGALEDVPDRAISLTIPAIMRIPELILSVPGARKSAVVARTLQEAISTACPATILRRHANASLYVDAESAVNLERQ